MTTEAQPMRCACIDIGSNTTRLLVAERDGDGLREVAAQRAFTSLGAGRTEQEPIPAQKFDEVAAAVAAQVDHARSKGARHIVAVATAAIRGAPNAEALLQAVSAAAGVSVLVLTGAREAEYAFRGATSALHGDDLVGVADVGGGSTELVLGTPAGGAGWAVSLGVGSARLPPTSDPPLPAEIAVLREMVAAEFAQIEPPGVPVQALAAGGSATSVYRLVGPALSSEALATALEVLASASAADLAARTGLEAQRVALLPRGLVLLEAVGRTFRAPLWIAPGGLREGVLLAEFARLEQS